MHGTQDFTEDFSSAERLRAWAVEAGLPLDFHAVEGGGHFIDVLATDESRGVSLHQRSIDWITAEVFGND